MDKTEKLIDWREDERKDRHMAGLEAEKEKIMQLMKIDPRTLKTNPDNTRQSKSTSQADALLLATIKAVGVIQHGLNLVRDRREGGVERGILRSERRTEHRHGGHLGEIALGGRHRDLAACVRGEG